ncbi:hypothetical protein BE73_13345 [Xanthomonas oryzae pv. oryzicola]|nr:hypothetical protein BE73_13345 [Xanthomonas oryzae pv. oryzicola]
MHVCRLPGGYVGGLVDRTFDAMLRERDPAWGILNASTHRQARGQLSDVPMGYPTRCAGGNDCLQVHKRGAVARNAFAATAPDLLLRACCP